VVLFVRGSVDALSRPQIAVVGSRNATHQGLQTARDFSARLSECGFAITSGLARGIDGAAHAGCLEVDGCTIAVAATGPERVYPAVHGALAARIVEAGGAIVTEFPPGVPPKAGNFPRRNRIISGLSLGTLVIEAAVRSGSLITARFAAEQGREVFAIPGSIHNPAARGCHRLIRQGARLVEQVDDILEEFEWLAVTATAVEECASDDGQGLQLEGLAARVHDAIDYGPTDFDTLTRRTGLGAMEISSALVELELRGLVCKSAGFFSRRSAGR
jgi:DNA processing protein